MKGELCMNQFHSIQPSELQNSVFQTIGKEWMLITAEKEVGGRMEANTMTASWGGLGHLWNKEVAFVFIRPQRYTKEFVDTSDRFSLCFFGGDRMQEMTYLGRVSGRDEDKIQKSGLKLTHLDGVPCFEEATTVLICRKLYVQTLREDCFVDTELCNATYPLKDFHDVYVAEIEHIYVR